MADEEEQRGSTITLVAGEPIAVGNPPAGVAGLMKRHAGEGVIAFRPKEDGDPPIYIALDKIVSWTETPTYDVFVG